MRDAVAPRRRPAARHRPRRTPVHQPRASRSGACCRRCTTGAPTTRATVLETISETYDLEVDRAADPQDDQVRRGAGRRPLDPRRPAAAARAPRPTARWPRTWSSGRSGRDEDEPTQEQRRATPRRRRRTGTPRSGRATGGSAALGVVAGGHADRRARRAGVLPSAARRRPRTTRLPGRIGDGRGAAAVRRRPTTRATRPRPPRRRQPPARTRDRGRDRPATATRPCRRTPATARGSCSARAGSGSGWSTRTATSSGPTWSRAASTTTSTRAPTRSTHAPSRPRLRRLRDDAVLRPLRPGRHGAAIGFHDIPVDDGDAGADRRPARHAAVARLHPSVARGRDRALGLRAARHRRSSSPPRRRGQVEPGQPGRVGRWRSRACCPRHRSDDAGCGCGWRGGALAVRGRRRPRPSCADSAATFSPLRVRVRLRFAVRGRRSPPVLAVADHSCGHRVTVLAGLALHRGRVDDPALGARRDALVVEQVLGGGVGLLRLVERQVERLVDHLPAVRCPPSRRR